MVDLGGLRIQGGRRRWLWRAVVLLGLAGTIAAGAWLAPALIRLVSAYLQQPLNEQGARADVASVVIAAAGLVISFVALVVAVLQLRQASGSDRPVAPQVRREQQAIDRLRVHLGRQASLRRIDDPATKALALRVHPAIDLPVVSTGTATDGVDTNVAGWRRRLPGRWSGRAHRTPGLDRDLPAFVDREKSPELRAWLRTAREEGGFLVIEPVKGPFAVADRVAGEVGVGVGEVVGEAGVVVAVAGVQVAAEATSDLVFWPVTELVAAEGGRGLQMLQQLAVAGVGLAVRVWWPGWAGV